MGAATVAVGWSGYACSALHDAGVTCPLAISSAPYARSAETGAWYATGGAANLPAAGVCLALTAVCVRGVRESARVTNTLVLIKLGVLLIFLIAVLPHVDPGNWSPFFVPGTGDGRYGAMGLLTGSAVVFFAFIGARSRVLCIGLVAGRGARAYRHQQQRAGLSHGNIMHSHLTLYTPACSLPCRRRVSDRPLRHAPRRGCPARRI